MEELILTGYEILTVLFPAFIIIWVFCLRYQKKGLKRGRGHIRWPLIFAVYLFGVFHFTGVGYGLNVVLFLP